MSSFLCVCGARFRDEDEPPGASCVAYPLHELDAIESRIAEYAADFVSHRDEAARSAWLGSHFHERYPTEVPDRGVIEDIVSRELNDGFIAMFRCPSCNRVALCDPQSKEWAFFRPERTAADAS